MQILTTDFFAEVARNKIIWSSCWSWGIAQSTKVISGLIKERRFDFRWIMGTGGMPSAHSAGVSALATAVGLVAGFDTVEFAITAIFALIIMFDAQGLRRNTGLQAEALNRIIEDIYLNRGIKQERLKELIGHTLIEVFMGALLGIVTAIFIMTW